MARSTTQPSGHSSLGRSSSVAWRHPETAAIRGGRTLDPETRSVVAPIHQTTTYAQPTIGEAPEFTYSRAHNPTVQELERALAALEGLPHARAFSTGMAAITALVLATVRADDHVICSDVVYGGTARLLDQIVAPLGVRTTYVDSSDVGAVVAALEPRTRLVLVETPANPTLKVSDLGALGDALRDHPALLAVDNTFLTAALQKPGDLGADVVVYSTTKYIDGHNVSLGGALLTHDSELVERIDLVRKTTGAIQSPWNAWLTLNGLKTLPLRMKAHSHNAHTVAQWLQRCPEVTSVSYPWLASFPQRDLARRQQLGGGGLVTFSLNGGLEESRRFVEALELVTLAEDLGATETLITHPATMTHGDLSPAQRTERGILDTTLRLSVGLEHTDDVISDLEKALGALSRREQVA